ncbi:hypothetical protein OIO90_003826 [Microbotryomycetes sp. JL221]|nr:hypothetical protein OIO90_003826 [Microbotryomycetes sp. JL221]
MPHNGATANDSIKSPPLPALPPPSPAPVPSQRIASSSSKWPSSLSNSNTTITGPNLPSTVLRDRQHRLHERRPSRAERYEQTVDHARQLLRRTTPSHNHLQHNNNNNVGLGIDANDAAHHHQDQHDYTKSATTTTTTPAELKEAVSSLLKVIDGMARQLATHDELAAQLKIAQSNLTLAETHSQFLEETLKKRDSSVRSSQTLAGGSSPAPSSQQMMSRHSASGAPLPSIPPHRASVDGATDSSRPSSRSSHSHSGNNNDDGNKLTSGFFARLPSVRKPIAAISGTHASNRSSAGSTSHSQQSRHVKRSSSSSPHRGNDSIRNRLSADLSSHPSPRDLASKSHQELVQEVIALHHQVSSLEQSYYGMQSTNTSMRKTADKLATKCAELEKTKDDLMAELENLSMELFQEANTMVAEERKTRAKAEEEVERLRTEVASLRAELDGRKGGDHKRGSVSSSTTTTTLDAGKADNTYNNNTLKGRDLAALREGVKEGLPTPKPDTGAGLGRPGSSSSNLQPSRGDNASASSLAPSPDPDTASLNSNSSRKWFQFGRSLSRKVRSTTSTEDNTETLQDMVTVSPNPSMDSQSSSLAPPSLLSAHGSRGGVAPAMARANSGGSTHSLSSVASSFFSARSNDGDHHHHLHHGAQDHTSQSLHVDKNADTDNAYDVQTPMPQHGNPRSPPLHIDTTNLTAFQRSESNASMMNSAAQRERGGLVSTFSPDSSNGPSPNPPEASSDDKNRRQQQQQSQKPPSSRSPRLAMTFGEDPTKGKPVAVRSFEGEGTAKSPKTPNERRWEKLAGSMPVTSSSVTMADSISRPKSPLVPTNPTLLTTTSRSTMPVKQEPGSNAAVVDDKRRPAPLDLSKVPVGASRGMRRRSTDSGLPSPSHINAHNASSQSGTGTTSGSGSVAGVRPGLVRASSSSQTATMASSSTTSNLDFGRGITVNGFNNKPLPLKSSGISLNHIASNSASSNSINANGNKFLQPLPSPTSYVSPLHQTTTKNNGLLPSPTNASFQSNVIGNGGMSTSTSMSSLMTQRSPTAVEDLEGLMRNIQDMSKSLFGEDQSDEWGLNGQSKPDESSLNRT